MVRNFHEDLKSRWFLIDIVEGFVVVVVGFVLLLGEFLYPSVPLPFYVVESSIDFSFSFSLFSGIILFLLSFSLILGDFSAGGGRGGWRGKRGSGFSVFESSLIGDSDGEWWGDSDSCLIGVLGRP